MNQEQKDLANEGWKRFFIWLNKNPDGGVFEYLNLKLEVNKIKDTKIE